MAIPTLFKHFVQDDKKARSRYTWDLITSFIALVIILGYGVVSVIDLLTTTHYEGVCSNNVTAKTLCDEWSFRQCSYFGNNVGTKGIGPQNNAPAPPKADCFPVGGGDCAVHDFTSPNFCTNYHGGKFDSNVLWSYLWYGNPGNEVAEFKEEARSSNYMCCGQIEQTIIQKLVIWIGIVGGAAGVIMKIVGVVPAFGCVKKEEEEEQVEVPNTV